MTPLECWNRMQLGRLGLLAAGVWLAGTLSAVAQPILYTAPEPVAFAGSGISGTVNPVTAGQAAMFDFSGSGSIFDATVGNHVCHDDVGFFGSCFDAMGDLFLYSITLAGDSEPQSNFSPFVTMATVSPVWAGYILDDDPTTREPAGVVVVSGGRGVTFLNLDDVNNPGFYLQPGETSAVLVTEFTSGLGDDVAGGAIFGIRFLPSAVDEVLFTPVQVPEPATMMLLAFAGIGFLRQSRSRI